MKTIGIIGGAGPMASCHLYKLIIQECQQLYGCIADADFPRMIIINYPFVDMLTVDAGTANRILLIKQLQECIDQLASQGAQVIAIACNTLHTFLPDITIPASCKLVHIAQTTLDYAHQIGCQKLLILATATTIEQRLYATPTIACVTPTAKDQDSIDQIITDILAGKITRKNSQKLSAVIKKYFINGIVLGCTELTLLNKQILSKNNRAIVIFDTLQILAQQVIKHSLLRDLQEAVRDKSTTLLKR